MEHKKNRVRACSREHGINILSNWQFIESFPKQYRIVRSVLQTKPWIKFFLTLSSIIIIMFSFLIFISTFFDISILLSFNTQLNVLHV
jgi:hypothetical protein